MYSHILTFFIFVVKIPVFIRSAIVYKFKRGDCNATYCGKTKHHFKVRIWKYLGVSALTGKRVKEDNNSAIKKHHLSCNHSSGFEDLTILASSNNGLKITLMIVFLSIEITIN